MRNPSSEPASRMLSRAFNYTSFMWDFFIARRNRPFILGLVVTDICNLACKHCRVANIYHTSMTFDEVKRHLTEQYAQGIRYLYLEGGEPYLWRDGDYHLPDIVKFAKSIGYFRVHVYTNGTVALDDSPDFTWISIDGLGDIFKTIRGIPVEHVLDHVRQYNGHCGIVYTINTINYRHIHDFLKFIHSEFPGIRVMFYFHTPYYGIDYLFLKNNQRLEAIDTLAKSKREGLPVMNSYAGLKALASGNYFHPTNLWRVIDSTGEYQCCRAFGNPEVCANCGYSTCAEIVLARNWRIGPIALLMRAY
jgi:MoaA/NifB/PqqE/SkfB family radical SAM enzyme